MLDNRACTPPPPPFQLGRRGGKNFTKVFVGGGRASEMFILFGGGRAVILFGGRGGHVILK